MHALKISDEDWNKAPDELKKQLSKTARTPKLSKTQEAILNAVKAIGDADADDVLFAIWKATGRVVNRNTFTKARDELIKKGELIVAGRGLVKATTGPSPVRKEPPPKDTVDTSIKQCAECGEGIDRSERIANLEYDDCVFCSIDCLRTYKQGVAA